jgi:hypothetical protein
VIARDLLLAQGLYYVASGLWPLAHMRSFLRVTGPKTDLWLVKTVGLLIAVIGASLLASRARGAAEPETVVLAAGSAFALAGVDVAFSASGTISRIYLLDAAAEAALVGLWVRFAGVT